MNEEEVEHVFHEYWMPIFRFVNLEVGIFVESEDITGGAFARLWANRKKVDPSKVKNWLYTVVKRILVDRHRGNLKEPVCISLEMLPEKFSDSSGDPYKSVSAREEFDYVGSVSLECNSKKEHDLLFKYIYEGYSAKESRELLGTTIGGRGQMRERAIRNIREFCGRRF